MADKEKGTKTQEPFDLGHLWSLESCIKHRSFVCGCCSPRAKGSPSLYPQEISTGFPAARDLTSCMQPALQKTLIKCWFCLVLVNQTTMFFKIMGCLPRLSPQMLSLHPCLLYIDMDLTMTAGGEVTDFLLRAVSWFIMVTKWKPWQCRKISPISSIHTSETKLSLSLKTSSHRTDLFAGQNGSFAHSIKVGLRGWGNVLRVLRHWIRKVTNYLQIKVTQISLLKTINH